jgi:hypothetical protein
MRDASLIDLKRAAIAQSKILARLRAELPPFARDDRIVSADQLFALPLVDVGHDHHVHHRFVAAITAELLGIRTLH